MKKSTGLGVLFVCAMVGCRGAMAQNVDLDEPVKYVGEDHTSNSDYDHGYHDGQMRPAVGVQNTQVLRVNRTYPEKSDGLGWTYNHAPTVAYWNDRFYFHYLSNPTGEHIPPGVTLLTSSTDGKHWEKPRVIFPIYFVAKSDASIVFDYMHQRMGFYVAPDGRLLTMGAYGGPYGEGVGRVVREIYPDQELGPIYFIKVNDNWEGEVKYPMYTSSPDAGFIEACDAFMADKVRRMQWWEENQSIADADDFFRVPKVENNGRQVIPEAFTFYTLDDGRIVAFFKHRWVALSDDQGESWTQPVRCNTLTYSGAKVWPQRLENGRYALVYNPTDGWARHPLCVATSDDGFNYDDLLNVHSEVPPKRFWGREKRPGPQYVRGIVEGNGNPPGDDLWVVYSVNKEDMWISRIPVPIRGEVTGNVADDFGAMEPGGVVTDWNIYSPTWCPVGIAESPEGSEKVLMLKDFDPYDYAKAVRVFEKSSRIRIEFRLYVEANPEILAIEVVAAKGARCVQLEVDQEGRLLAKDGEQEMSPVSTVEMKTWMKVAIEIDAGEQRYSLKVDDEAIAEDLSFAAEGEPERILFQTGKYRLEDDVREYKSGDDFVPGWDEPGADETAPEATYYLADFEVESD